MNIDLEREMHLGDERDFRRKQSLRTSEPIMLPPGIRCTTADYLRREHERFVQKLREAGLL